MTRQKKDPRRKNVGKTTNSKKSTPILPANAQIIKLNKFEDAIGRPRCSLICARLGFPYPPQKCNQAALLLIMLAADERDELRVLPERGLRIEPKLENHPGRAL